MFSFLFHLYLKVDACAFRYLTGIFDQLRIGKDFSPELHAGNALQVMYDRSGGLKVAFLNFSLNFDTSMISTRIKTHSPLSYSPQDQLIRPILRKHKSSW